MIVYWLEQSAGDVPEDDAWLSPGEAIRLRGMRFPKRRADWRLGRWAAKCAAAAHRGFPTDVRSLSQIDVPSAPTGAPTIDGFSISLSHRGGTAMCALAQPGALLGCDLELVERRSDAFVADYFTQREQSLVARADAADHSRIVALLWSAKESALKAMGAGLRLDTREVEVEVDMDDGAFDTGGWRSMTVRQLHGWWQLYGRLVMTVVADPRPAMPRRLVRTGMQLNVTF